MHFHHERVSTGMGLEEFLRVLYPSQGKYRVAAAHLLRAVAEKKDEGLSGYELMRLCEKKSISRATMQKVFVHLRSFGVIDRRAMRYYLNTEFSTALRRLGEAWRRIMSNNKFDFDETTLKVNL